MSDPIWRTQWQTNIQKVDRFECTWYSGIYGVPDYEPELKIV